MAQAFTTLSLRLVVYAAGILSILMAILIGCGVARVSIVADSKQLLPVSSPQVDLFRQVQNMFGTTSTEFILVDGGNYSDRGFRHHLRELAFELKNIPGVRSVLSPAHAFIENAKLPIRVWTEDRTWGRFIVELDGDLSLAERTVLHTRIDESLRRYPTLTFLRSGGSYLGFLISEQLNSHYPIVMLFSAALVFGAALLFFRKVKAALGITLIVATSVLWGIFPAAIFIIPLGLVSQLAPLIILVLSVFFCFISAAARFKSTASGLTVLNIQSRQLQLPWCVIPTDKAIISTCIIAALGSLTMLTINIEDLRRLAILLSWGVMVSGFFSITAVAVMADLCSNKEASFGNPITSPTTLPTPLKAVILFIFAVPLIFLVERPAVQTALTDYLSESSTAYESVSRALRAFPADKQIFVIINRNDNSPLSSEDLSLVQRITERFRLHPDIYDAVSYPDILLFNEAHRTDLMTAGGKNPISAFDPLAFLTADKGSARITIETRLEGQLLIELLGQLGDVLRSQFNLGQTGAAQPITHLGAFIVSEDALAVDEHQTIMTQLTRPTWTMVLCAFIGTAALLRKPRLVRLSLVPLVAVFSISNVATGLFFDRILLGTATSEIAICTILLACFFAALFFDSNGNSLKGGSLDGGSLRNALVQGSLVVFALGLLIAQFGGLATEGFGNLIAWAQGLVIVFIVVFYNYLFSLSAEKRAA